MVGGGEGGSCGPQIFKGLVILPFVRGDSLLAFNCLVPRLATQPFLVKLCVAAGLSLAAGSMLPQRGRKRHAPTAAEHCEVLATVNSLNSVQSIVNALADVRGSAPASINWKRKLAHSELFSVANTLTSYGTVCLESTVHGKASTITIYHCNPFSLLLLATESSSMFFDFLSQIVVAAPLGLDICYYLDKAKPGNQERPDHARSSQCIYWSCLQFPSWFRSRRNGWIPFAYVNVAEQLEADLTDSMLVRFLVRTFDSSVSELAFSKGFTLRSHDGRSIVVRLRRQLTVADWEQHVKTMSLKGYNGSVPCGICRNVLGRCPFLKTIQTSCTYTVVSTRSSTNTRQRVLPSWQLSSKT